MTDYLQALSWKTYRSTAFPYSCDLIKSERLEELHSLCSKGLYLQMGKLRLRAGQWFIQEYTGLSFFSSCFHGVKELPFHSPGWDGIGGIFPILSNPFLQEEENLTVTTGQALPSVSHRPYSPSAASSMQ